MEEAGNGNALVITHTREVQTQQIVTENIEILQSLNLSLQVQLANLQTENNKLKKEMECIKAREKVHDLLSADLALIRGQFDKTATALLNKCQENSNLKKEIAALKAGGQQEAPIVRKRLITVPSPLRARLTLTRRNSDVSSDGTSEVSSYNGRGRPSMGSCGNLATQIASEEVMPARSNPMALLRNRVLMKLHLRSASTESLESAGRKSFRPEPVPRPTNSVRAPARKPTGARPTPSTSVQAMRSAPNSIVKPQPPPRNYRPALGPSNSNGQRVIKVSNVTALKRSNSSSSNKSTSSTRPAFRF